LEEEVRRIIATAIDDSPHYMEGLKVFLKSARLNSPDSLFFVHLMNPVEGYADSIKDDSITVEISHTTETNPFVRNYVRHGILLDLIRHYDQVAWMDNDIIIRKPLYNIWDDVGPNNLKIWYRDYYHKVPTKRDRMEVFFQGGVYVVGNGDPVKKWLTNIIKNLEGKTDWYLPQGLLYTCWKEDNNLKHVQLSETYNDYKFNEKSHVWHCKNSGFTNETYQKEYQKYL
jgi:hypothetical protein